MSIDHKPERSDEKQRIEEAGGFIIWAGKLLLLCLICIYLLCMGLLGVETSAVKF